MSLENKISSLISNIKHHNQMKAEEFGIKSSPPQQKGASKRQKQPQQPNKRLRSILESEKSALKDSSRFQTSPKYVDTIDNQANKEGNNFNPYNHYGYNTRDPEFRSDLYHVTNTISDQKYQERSFEKGSVESTPKVQIKFNEVQGRQYSPSIGDPDSAYRGPKTKVFEKDEELESIVRRPKPVKLENIQKVLVPGRRNQDLLQYSQSQISDVNTARTKRDLGTYS